MTIQNETPPPPKEQSSTLPIKLAATTLIIALGSLGLTLTGIGVALASESFSGLPFSTLIGSPLDATELSVWGVAHFAEGLIEGQKNWRMYRELALSNMVYGGFAMFLVVAARIGSWRKRSQSTVREPDPRPLLTRLLTFNENELGFWPFLRKLGVAAVAVVSTATLLQLAFLFATLTVFAMLALVPSVGMAAGKRHILEYVVLPTRCVSVVNRDDRLSSTTRAASGEKRSTCVEISKDSTVLGRGRVVFSTSSATLLFDPRSGAIQRVPTDGAIVTLIDAL